jgi:hypothetical protein
MTRRLGAAASVAILLASAVAGAGAGVAARATTDGPAPPTGDRSASADRVLTSADVLAASDFGAVGWQDLQVDHVVNGEPQFAYACQRASLTGIARPAGTVSAAWTVRQGLTAAETVAQLENPPQASELYRRISGWYRDCGGADPTPSTLVASVDVAGGAGQVWRLGRAAAGDSPYGLVVRAGDRVGMVDLYGDVTPVDASGLRDLATRAVERLG